MTHTLDDIKPHRIYAQQDNTLDWRIVIKHEGTVKRIQQTAAWQAVYGGGNVPWGNLSAATPYVKQTDLQTDKAFATMYGTNLPPIKDGIVQFDPAALKFDEASETWQAPCEPDADTCEKLWRAMVRRSKQARQQ